MKCHTVLGVIDLAKFIDIEEKFTSFNLFDSFLAWKNDYKHAPIKLNKIYNWHETSDRSYINIRKGDGPSQRILKQVKLTPEFYFNTGLYDAEGGKESNTLVSNSDERIVRNLLCWYSTFQPSLEGIREIRIFMHVSEAEKIFDLDKISRLIEDKKITSKDPQNVNQPYTVLEKYGVIKDVNKLKEILRRYLTESPILSNLINKLRIKWDPLHKKTVFEIYYSDTLNPLLPSLTEALLFKLPEKVKKGIETPWINWVLTPSNFMNMGSIDLTTTKNKQDLLASYRRAQKLNDSMIITRGKSLTIKSKLQVSPMFLFGLSHFITEKFSTSTPWELAGYSDFVSTFGNPQDLISNISIVFLAEEYTVLMKRLTTLFDDIGNFRNIDDRHKELEQKIGDYLSTVTGGKIPASKIKIHKIPYKEGIAVVMTHFPELFKDLRKLADRSKNIKQKINEVIRERGLGRHAGKASFHMTLKGTLLPLIEVLAEKALNNFCQFFDAYVT